ncbi:nuclear transport factor 2 family protein [Xanthobacter versatilis]|uniref:nuclear transport factor 2 family protein n=1 Tax=Xanthobacter autotrophicus (strain ATCC BAA-1158 / Py2) TaxID=78245 RepID=UPI0037288948
MVDPPAPTGRLERMGRDDLENASTGGLRGGGVCASLRGCRGANAPSRGRDHRHRCQAPAGVHAPQESGSTGFSAVDRLAIENLIWAYSLAYDNGQADAWLGLFTDDAVFVAGVPGGPPVAFSGEGFRAFWRERMKAVAASGNVRRHLMSNMVFIDQSDAAAHVSVVGLLANTSDGRTFSVVSSLNYEGWLVKGADGWKIARWHDFPDAPVGQ